VRLRNAAAALPGTGEFLGQPLDQDWREVRRYPPGNADGHEVRVLCQRWPAVFYRIEVRDLNLILETGSGQHELADSIAVAVAAGLLGIGDGEMLS
jgi:hypothetical protein